MNINILCIAVLALTVLHADVSRSACPPEDEDLYDQTVTTYIAINETLYDRNYSRIDSGRHPLGFYADVWQYNQGVANPCIKITGVNARASNLEIKVETVPTARLCMKDQSSASQCFEGTYADCRETPGNTIYVEFLCDSQCGEADVNFWYRLVLSPPMAVDWCLARSNLFPGDLATLPSGMTLPTFTTPSPPGGTGGAAPSGAPPSFLPLAAVLWALGAVL